MFRNLKWRKEWAEQTSDPTVLHDRMRWGTTPVSREDIHYRPWTDESPPTAADHLDYLVGSGSANVDDFRAMHAVVSWLEGEPYNGMGEVPETQRGSSRTR